ncbi:MAG: glycerophosphodiester phosphodiesterase family protein [Planctomycetota bacterium]|nr:glycerophosphodiester phosphodiesterase family protein [Planctomycetota bacterium]
MSPRSNMSRWVRIAAGFALVWLAPLARPTSADEPLPPVKEETPEQRQSRHDRVARRRAGLMVICHRGASEFAHENTLEAYRATFELGADGNEIDIRSTSDGVLVCFHDDMLDRLTDGWGDLSDVTWGELRQLKLTHPGPFGNQTRIPTLQEVLELHREYAGLLHLDIKRPGMDRKIADLLDRLDMWDHVPYCNGDNGGVILRDKRYRPGRYRGGLYQDRSEVFPEAIAAVLEKPGDGVIVDDPRGVVLQLGRSIGKPSREPVALRAENPSSSEVASPLKPSEIPPLIRTLRDAGDWNQVGQTVDEQRAFATRIRARAEAARALDRATALSSDDRTVLAERVRNRSLHPDWMWHGLDGAFAFQTLVAVPGGSIAQEVELARFVLWRDDPALEPVVNPEFKNPRAWTDFRVKMVIFPTLARLRDQPSAANLCREYLALSDADARPLGPDQFREAAVALLRISPTTETALELLRHRLQVVRGETILRCLQNSDETWATAALEQAAPHALRYIVPGK